MAGWLDGWMAGWPVRLNIHGTRASICQFIKEIINILADTQSTLDRCYALYYIPIMDAQMSVRTLMRNQSSYGFLNRCQKRFNDFCSGANLRPSC
jgi:hypothetical protein